MNSLVRTLKSNKRIRSSVKGIRTGGLVLGLNKCGDREEIFYEGDDAHSLVIGATRCGKTRCEVIQSICVLGLAGESIVISDPKGELYDYTSIFLEKLKYNVITIDFQKPEKSHRYNPLQPAIDALKNNDPELAQERVMDLANVLVAENTKERIWSDGERSVMAAAMMCVVFDNMDRPEFQNMLNVYWFIAKMCSPKPNSNRVSPGMPKGKESLPIVDYINSLDDSHPAKPLLSVSTVAPERTKGSFYTGALTTLQLYSTPLMSMLMSTSDFSLRDIGEKKTALFIILPDQKTTYYEPASILVSQIYEALVESAKDRGGRLKNRVNLILDEFANFAPIPEMPAKLTVGGGYGIRFNMFIQDFALLEKKYDKEVLSTIKANCKTLIYLKSGEPDVLKEVSDRLDDYTTTSYSLSSSRNGRGGDSSSKQLMGRKLLTPGEVAKIDRPYNLVIGAKHPALMYCPDLSKWAFNKILGLGDKDHNNKLRQRREKMRPNRNKKGETKLWKIWEQDIMARS